MSTADRHCRGCSVYVHTDMSMVVIEQYLAEEEQWSVKELDE